MNLGLVSDSNEIELLFSTILPWAKRLKDNSNDLKVNRSTKARTYGGKITRKFIYNIRNLLDSEKLYKLKKEYENIEILVEDKSTVKLKDLIGTQDEIIHRIKESENNNVLCILKGSTLKAQKIKNNVKIPLSVGTNPLYKNSMPFSLFIRWDYLNKNIDFIRSIENALIICYGEAIVNEYGIEIEIYSIENQIVVLRKH